MDKEMDKESDRLLENVQMSSVVDTAEENEKLKKQIQILEAKLKAAAKPDSKATASNETPQTSGVHRQQQNPEESVRKENKPPRWHRGGRNRGGRNSEEEETEASPTTEMQEENVQMPSVADTAKENEKLRKQIQILEEKLKAAVKSDDPKAATDEATSNDDTPQTSGVNQQNQQNKTEESVTKENRPPRWHRGEKNRDRRPYNKSVPGARGRGYTPRGRGYTPRGRGNAKYNIIFN